MDGKIWVRASISLPGLPLGREVLVDPTDPYMADCLERGYLQPIQSDEIAEVEPVAEGDATVEGGGDAIGAAG